MKKILESSIRLPKPKLGRWNTIVGLDNNKRDVYKDMLKNCDMANHDHCGGQLCSIPIFTDHNKKLCRSKFIKNPVTH